MKKVNVFHLAPFPYASGGIDTWLNNLIHGLQDEFFFTVYCPSPVAGAKACFDLSGLRNVDIVYGGQFAGHASQVLWALRLFLRTFRRVDCGAPTLVLSTVPSIFAPVLLKKAGRLQGRLICSVRGQLAQDAIDIGKGPALRWFVRTVEGFFLRQVDEIVANGWDTQEYLRSFYGLPSRVIPNGFVHRDGGAAAADVAWVEEQKKAGKLVFSHIGTVRKMKFIDAILEAVSLLTSEERARALFVFVGKGQIPEYKELARRLGVEVFFLGERSNVWPYIDSSDFIINVSGGSGVSNSLIEAMSRGKPVITWDNRTFTQVVNSPALGIVCRHLDSEALADGLRRALAAGRSYDPAAIRAAAAAFSWNALEPAWRALLAT